MRKCYTWPGDTAMDSLSNMDSAGSCDSVISINSTFSDDSLGHLSAEERACLLYLEETIESLEVELEEDSGLSNDEPESHLSAAETAHLSNTADQTGNDVPCIKYDDSGNDQKLFLSCGDPTPLLLAQGASSLPNEAPTDLHEPQTTEVSSKPTATPLTVNSKVEHHPIIAAEDSKAPALERNDLETSDAHSEVQEVTDSETSSSATKAEMFESGTDGDDSLCITTDDKMDLALIPPPADFMDEQGPQPELGESRNLPMSVETSANGEHIDLEDLPKGASMQRNPICSPEMQDDSPMSAVEIPDSPSAPDAPSVPLSNPHTGATEPRSPPAVAPKPKKLPPNIILKPHKASFASSEGNSASSGSGRLLLDPQKIRMEALRKLGLLKSDEADAGPLQSPNLSPKSWKSWAAPPSPISSVTRQTPTPPSTPSPALSIGTVPASASSPSVTLGRISPQATSIASTPALATDILPAPVAFSDAIDPPRYNGDPSPLVDIPQLTANPSSTAANQVTSSKTESATLERSGMSPSSYTLSQRFSEFSQGSANPSHRRPASIGYGQDFSSLMGETLTLNRKDSDTRRSMPASTMSWNAGPSQSLPRSQGISVLICPLAGNEEGRREALRKLGLLKE